LQHPYTHQKSETVLYIGWRDSLVVSVLDLRSRGRVSGLAGCGWSHSNRGPVALCLGLLNLPSL